MANLKSEFDYSLVNGVSQLLYLGQAEEWTAQDDSRWAIKKFYWIIAADGTTQLGQVAALTGVSWASRASLSWP